MKYVLDTSTIEEKTLKGNYNLLVNLTKQTHKRALNKNADM